MPRTTRRRWLLGWRQRVHRRVKARREKRLCPIAHLPTRALLRQILPHLSCRAVSVCLVFVTFVYYVETSKHILNLIIARQHTDIASKTGGV